MDRWRGRVALVTGASVGIGRCIAIRLLNHGMNVVACARRVEAVETIRSEVRSSSGRVGELMAVKCDLSKVEDTLEMFKNIKQGKFGGVDVCINNAGLGIMGTLTDGSTDDWKRMLDVNVMALSICTRETLKSMKERHVDDGHVIHISSVASYSNVPTAVFYTGTKWMVRALTEGLRQELINVKSGIRVTQICPGYVKTEWPAIAGGEEFAENLFTTTPHLLDKDVAASVEHALAAPRHVQVQDVIVRPIKLPEGH